MRLWTGTFRRALAVALIMSLLAALALMNQIGQAQDQIGISTVNGELISQDDFQARVRFVRWQYLQELNTIYEITGGSVGIVQDRALALLASLDDPQSLGDSVLSQMEEERLLWQTAQEMDLLPGDEEVSAAEAAFFSAWTNVAVDDLPTDETAQTFIADWYANVSTASGLSQDDIRAIFAYDVARQKLFDHLAASVPTEEPSIHSRHILCSFHPDTPSNITPPTADERAAAESCIAQAQARLTAGDSFEDVARALSNDTTSGALGGDLGWILVSYLTQPYADAASAADLNQVIGPVETEFGLHLIEVLERRVEPLSEADLAESQQGYFDLWIQSLWAEAAIERSENWNADIPVEPSLDTLDPDVLTALRALQSDEGGME